MTSSTTSRLRRFVLATLGAVSLAGVAVGFPAIASAEPVCPNDNVRVQGEVVPAPENQVCDDDPNDGLLGDLPVVGNLPGVGGVL
jgi:hypothetical protein